MQDLTETQRIVIRARLTKAETAYDELLTGKAVKRFVDQNGEQVEYTVANAERLEDYIQSLKDQLNPLAARFRRTRRAIGFTF